MSLLFALTLLIIIIILIITVVIVVCVESKRTKQPVTITKIETKSEHIKKIVNICPNCGGKMDIKNGMYTCPYCGTIID